MGWVLPAVVTLALTLTVVLPAKAQIGTAATTISHGAFNLAEAYPCTPGTYAAALGITDPGVFTGVCPAQAGAPGAAPGVLCLQRQGTSLDVNCFAVIPAGQTGPCFVQIYRLTKIVPGSFKCPDVYGLPQAGGYHYFQFGAGVRTWWALNFTQPGTQFLLEVASVCRAAPKVQLDANGQPVLDTDGKQIVLVPGGKPLVHWDQWTWRVVADVNTLAYVIELMHEGAISTLEVPCIVGEDMYDALKKAQARLAGAIKAGIRTEVGNAIFDFEALIVSNCLFVEVLNPPLVFPGPDQFGAAGFQPPGNLAPSATIPGGGTAIAGIIDTTEHPCCCKLLVDLEWIAIKNGITGPQTLPTF
jgi:hypothetical protein